MTAPDCFELDVPLDLKTGDTWLLDGVEVELAPCNESSTFRVVGDCFPVLSVGMTVELSFIEDLERDLFQLWDPIRNRHAGLAEAHWDRVLAFGKAFLPSQSSIVTPWILEHVQHAIHSYERKATRGADFWDRMHAPPRFG